MNTEKKATIISPIDGAVIAERAFADNKIIDAALLSTKQAHHEWQALSIKGRAALCQKAIQYFHDNSAAIAQEITLQMGRPLKYSPGEIIGLSERAHHMINLAENSLADEILDDKPGFQRFIHREPLGSLLVIAPWNYPYLTAINSIIPALMAGNTVILKHARQTLLCAERFQAAFDFAGLPGGVFQTLHLDHASTEALSQHPNINAISFTGSVKGGEAIEKSTAGLFKHLTVELGGKDPAYVTEDACLDQTIENLVDGAFFNSGQSCCGIERIYVHSKQYNQFVDGFVALTKQYQLGNPLDSETTLGPMVSSDAANYVRNQTQQAITQGAKTCIAPNAFPQQKTGSAYLAPQILIGVDHSMSIMKDESFGPVIGIMSVDNDQQALSLMNDSDFGLTASIWTTDKDRAIQLGHQLETGTVFMNRCDYLDPALPWVGVKQSGRGCTLSRLGYQQLTRPKSFHLKLN